MSHENGYIVPWQFSIHQIVVLYTCPTKWLHHSSSEEDNINLQKFVFGIRYIAIFHVYNTGGTTCNFQTVKILHFIVALYLKYLCTMGNDQDALNASSVSCNIVYKRMPPYVKTKSSPTHINQMIEPIPLNALSHVPIFFGVLVLLSPQSQSWLQLPTQSCNLKHIVELHMSAWESKINIQGWCKVVGRTFDDERY